MPEVEPRSWPSPAELVAKLQSGEYKKARRALYRPGVGYCCLGVCAKEAGFTDEEIEEVPHLVELAYQVEKVHPDIFLPPWMTNMVHDDLTSINDGGKGWGRVIEYLKERFNV